MDITDDILHGVGNIEPPGIPYIDELISFAETVGLDFPSTADTFSYLDSHIKSDSLAFVRQGICLMRICRHNLFKFKKFRTFKDYCQKSLSKSISYCVRLMQAAGVVIKLIRAGFEKLPQNESQCRPLTKLSDEQLEEKWQQVLEIAQTPSHKGIITAQMVRELCDYGTSSNKTVRLKPDTYAKLQRLAAGTGKTIDELMDEAISNYLPDEEAEPLAEADSEVAERPSMVQRLANWQQDLEKLVEEFQPASREWQGDGRFQAYDWSIP